MRHSYPWSKAKPLRANIWFKSLGGNILDPLDGPLDDLLGDGPFDEEGNPVEQRPGDDVDLIQHHFYMLPRLRVRARSSSWLPMEEVRPGTRLVSMVRRGRSYVDQVQSAETPLVKLEIESKISFVTILLSAWQEVCYLEPEDRARGVRRAILSELINRDKPFYLPAKKGLYGTYNVRASKRSKATKRMFVRIDRALPAGEGMWHWPVINKRSDWACHVVIEPGLSLPASGLHIPD